MILDLSLSLRRLVLLDVNWFGNDLHTLKVQVNCSFNLASSTKSTLRKYSLPETQFCISFPGVRLGSHQESVTISQPTIASGQKKTVAELGETSTKIFGG